MANGPQDQVAQNLTQSADTSKLEKKIEESNSQITRLFEEMTDMKSSNAKLMDAVHNQITSFE